MKKSYYLDFTLKITPTQVNIRNAETEVEIPNYYKIDPTRLDWICNDPSRAVLYDCYWRYGHVVR